MSRWLWALLAGVVLVAIAAVFWIERDECPTPGLAGHYASRTCARSRLYCAERRALGSVLTFAPGRAEAAAPPAPAPAPDAGQQATSPPAPTAPSPEKPAAPPVVAQEPSPPPAPAPPAEAPLPPPAPGREAQEVAGIYAPKSLAQLVGTWAYSAADCERLFQRAAAAGPIGSQWTSSPRLRLSSRRRKSFSLPPSAGSRAHP